jgi:hypothetical protein
MWKNDQNLNFLQLNHLEILSFSLISPQKYFQDIVPNKKLTLKYLVTNNSTNLDF